MPLWELLLQEMHKPGRQARWEHVPVPVNMCGNEVANHLAVEGMCSNQLWSTNVKQDSDSESTVGLRGGSLVCAQTIVCLFILRQFSVRFSFLCGVFACEHQSGWETRTMGDQQTYREWQLP